MKQISNPKIALSSQSVIWAAIAWAVIALLFFLLFSASVPGEGRPEWYSVITYILENGALLGAGLLCFRNWQSSQIVSGRTVWLAIGLGMISYFIGNLLLAYWELGLGKAPDVSLGDFFFLPTYILLGWGMLQAVLSRRLNLTTVQWAALAGITIGSIALAYFLVVVPVSEMSPAEDPAAIEQTTPAGITTATPGEPAPAIAPTATPEPSTSPAWAVAIDDFLSPHAELVQKFYIAGDIILVVMATTLLLAFWGGRFSLSWRFISAAALSFYVADMWFLYATTYDPNYQTGALPEVFWIFSGCLFAVGAALEYDLSTRSRRTSRRRG